MFFNNPVACLALPTISEFLRGFQKLNPAARALTPLQFDTEGTWVILKEGKNLRVRLFFSTGHDELDFYPKVVVGSQIRSLSSSMT